MKISSDRILTTHVGSLPRPSDLTELLMLEDQGVAVDQNELQARVTKAVTATVASQVELGIDIVSDGEMSKMSYHIYTKHRLTGLENRPAKGIPGRPTPRDLKEFPEFVAERGQKTLATSRLQAVVCAAEVAYADHAPLNHAIATLAAAAEKAGAVDAFMNSASPGVLVNYVPNKFYDDDDAYRDALVAAMRSEYEAIHAAGFVLQLDCPDLAGSRHTDQQDMSDKEFLDRAHRRCCLKVPIHGTITSGRIGPRPRYPTIRYWCLGSSIRPAISSSIRD